MNYRMIGYVISRILLTEAALMALPVATAILYRETPAPFLLAAAALAVLGYSQAEINVALKGVDVDGQPLEQVIRMALKNMVKG